MERVLGIGGYFIRAADPAALDAWYRDCLGLDADENGLWHQETGPTVFATFESGTGYFGSRSQQTMLNFRVRDLDAMLAQLRANGADVANETQDMEGVGRFGWVTDPEGNPPDRSCYGCGKAWGPRVSWPDAVACRWYRCPESRAMTNVSMSPAWLKPTAGGPSQTSSGNKSPGTFAREDHGVQVLAPAVVCAVCRSR
jgi:predicted enzyme related to lactoylglutathione lyase